MTRGSWRFERRLSNSSRNVKMRIFSHKHFSMHTGQTRKLESSKSLSETSCTEIANENSIGSHPWTPLKAHVLIDRHRKCSKTIEQSICSHSWTPTKTNANFTYSVRSSCNLFNFIFASCLNCFDLYDANPAWTHRTPQSHITQHTRTWSGACRG